MIDLKILKENPDLVRNAVKNRGDPVDVEKIIELDLVRRKGIIELEALRKERNRLSEEVGRMKKQGQTAAELTDKAKKISEEVKAVEERQKSVEIEFEKLVQFLPNLPHESVPVGKGGPDNKFVRGLKEPPKYDFKPLPHWEIGEALDVLDLKRSAKISGSRFILLKGAGASLERALINFFLDLHVNEHGYREIMPPVLNNPAALYGTGQLPRLTDEMYRCRDDEFYLAPTAEVPVTNMHQGEILAEKDLPIRYAAYTPCFRREAGSYGKEVRGITRVHQFNKVELVKFATPETGYREFEMLLANAETAVKRLGLPYRILLLCTGDMTSAAAKTYDIEIYAPGMAEWLEVSSVSCYEQYQARRGQIRYRKTTGGVDYVYTINGSGLALPRIWIGIMENGQTPEGKVRIPEALRPYLGGKEYLEP
jgi:seryl-tRNA synthetase